MTKNLLIVKTSYFWGLAMATIKDIAEILGISTGTVSKGLTGADDISEDLRNKILDTAVSIGYVTKKMKNRKNWTVCIFIENMDYSANQFGYEIILGFKQQAVKNGCSVEIVSVTHEMQSNEKYDTYMMRHGYKAGFFVGFNLSDPWLQGISSTTVPTVLLDNIEENNPFVAYIGTDSGQGLETAVRHLKELGHKNVAFLNGDKNSMISKIRGFFFRKACEKYEINYGELIQYGDYTAECAKLYVEDFISNGATAIICSSDIMAMGAIAECENLGLKVPEDISVIGFDDLPLSAHMTPPLTTIRQERIDLGKQGYFTLYSLINGVKIGQTLLRPEFVIRGSTAQAKIKGD